MDLDSDKTKISCSLPAASPTHLRGLKAYFSFPCMGIQSPLSLIHIYFIIFGKVGQSQTRFKRLNKEQDSRLRKKTLGLENFQCVVYPANLRRHAQRWDSVEKSLPRILNLFLEVPVHGRFRIELSHETETQELVLLLQAIQALSKRSSNRDDKTLGRLLYQGV